MITMITKENCASLALNNTNHPRHVIVLMMEAARTSETSVDNYFTRQYIPEDKSELNDLDCS
jgi:hypothetical protein